MSINTLVTEEEVRCRASGSVPYVSIILPTYNESKNIAELLSLIQDVMNKQGWAYECIFVDDSKDNTPQVIEREAKSYQNLVTLIKRTGGAARSGLTMAFRRGFAEARGEFVVCMDTDLQHPPATIANLVISLEKGLGEVAVASRYAKGGSAEGLDGFFRKIVSRSSNYLVWLFLPSTRETTDPMTGFFAFRRSLLSTVDFSSHGFKILVELLTGLKQPRVIDVPFTFQKRQEEESKASLRQGFVFYRDVARLFMSGTYGSSTLRFGIVAILASLVCASMSLITVSATSQFSLFGTMGDNNVLESVNNSFALWLGIFIICLSAWPIFGWAFRRFEYNRFTRENFILIVSFVSILIFLFSYTAPTYQYPVKVFFALLFSFSILYGLGFLFWRKRYSILWQPRWLTVILCLIFVMNMVAYFVDFSVWWAMPLFLMYLGVIAQGLFALYLMVYAWEKPSPENGVHKKELAEPQYSFTAIIPCKHEKNTIADTIRALHRVNYPADKKQILIVIHAGTDDGTIDIVNQTITEIAVSNIMLVTYDEAPVNKPHGLNKALAVATGDYVAIFDAEDEPHPDLFKVVNSSILETNADVVQSGVQLMNYDSNWYSAFNVLEYYFWFKSSLHFYAAAGAAPLGGVSVFFRRSSLEAQGGWDMKCLTEDAEIGIRLSQAGAKISVIYDAEYATREETPPDLVGFVKQRTRWAQGFLQILARGSFLRFPKLSQKFLVAYILAWPIIIPFVFLLLPFGLVLMITVSLPPPLALLSNISLLIFISFVVTLMLGFYEFTREYKLRFSYKTSLILIIMLYPYTLLLTIASLRAMYRNIAQITVWEKTEHINTHRQSVAAALTASPGK